MIKVGIVIDPWKLKFFKKRLEEEKYSYDVFEGETITTIQVNIEVEKLLEIQEFIKKTLNEAQRSKMN